MAAAFREFRAVDSRNIQGTARVEESLNVCFEMLNVCSVGNQ
jgi:hypothetical protein